MLHFRPRVQILARAVAYVGTATLLPTPATTIATTATTTAATTAADEEIVTMPTTEVEEETTERDRLALGIPPSSPNRTNKKAG